MAFASGNTPFSHLLPLPGELLLIPEGSPGALCLPGALNPLSLSPRLSQVPLLRWPHSTLGIYQDLSGFSLYSSHSLS